jgi:hypothetical protein
MHLRDTPAAALLAVALVLAGSVAVALRAVSRWLQKPMPGSGDGHDVERDWLGQPVAEREDKRCP